MNTIKLKDKTYKLETKSGRMVKLYSENGLGEFPIHGAWWAPGLKEFVITQWDLNGKNKDFEYLDLEFHEI